MSACSTLATVVVEPGHRAVVSNPDGSAAVLDEGEADVDALAHVDDFDLRERVQADRFTALTADGVPLGVGEPSITFHFVPEELTAADRELGPDGAEPLVRAVLGAAISRVLATYRWDQLDPAHIREAESQVLIRVQAELRPHHLDVASVELKGLIPRLPLLAGEVTGTSIREQRALEARSQIDVARQRAEQRRTDAQGLAAANASLAPTLTPGVLQDRHDRAWQALLTAPATTLLVTQDPNPNLEVSP